MLENLSSSLPRQPYCLNDVVDEVLIFWPGLSENRQEILTIIQLAWRDEWPVDLFKKIGILTKKLPWLKNQLSSLISQTILTKISILPDKNEFYHSRQSLWINYGSEQLNRRLTRFNEFEGLLLLSMLKVGHLQNESAQRLLGRVLSQVYRGLPSVDSGKKKSTNWRSKSNYRHPLTDVFVKIGNPQTIERLAHNLYAIIPEIYSLYPRVGKFMEDCVLPFACEKLDSWYYSLKYDETDVLDTEKLPQVLDLEDTSNKVFVQKTDLDRSDILPTLEERALTAADLVNDIINYDNALLPHKEALLLFTNAWRDENTLRFFNAVAEITIRSPWLQALPKYLIHKPVLFALRKTKKNTDYYKYSFYRQSNKWRESQKLALIGNEYDSESLFMPIKGFSGLNLLKGLLFLGRVEWYLSDNKAAEDALVKLILSVKPYMKSEPLAGNDVSNLKPTGSLKLVLDNIEIVETQEQLFSALDILLPEIAKFDLETANLIGGAYFPLLGAVYTDAIPEIQADLNSLDNTEDQSSPKFIDDEPESHVKSNIQQPLDPLTGGLQRRKPSLSQQGHDRTSLRKNYKSSRQIIVKSRVNIPTTKTPLAGESIEESAPGICIFRRTDPSLEAISLKEEVRWVHQRIYGTNQLIVRNHIESLSDPEAFMFAKALDARIEEAIESMDVATGWICILVALTLITGQGVSTWTVVGQYLDDSLMSYQGMPRLLLNEGIFRLPIVKPAAAFKANHSMRKLLEATSETVNLHLPPSLKGRIDSLLKLGKASWNDNEEDLRRSLNALVSELEPKVGTGISLARVRLVARARIREATNDETSTMMLCGDTFGSSTAPLYYTSINANSLEQGFRAAAWPLFGDNPESSVLTCNNARVGSELLLTRKAVRDLATVNRVTLTTSHLMKDESEKLIKKHNYLVDYILQMLMAVAGHRPTSALLELTRFDFDTVKHAAVFRDKQCDPAHLFRFVPTADLISDQIEKYLEHLRVLVRHAKIKNDMTEKVKNAIYGRGALFFHISPNWLPIALTLNSWRNTLPSIWQDLPLNWGRTWLRSRGRDEGIDADHLSILLGHLESVGYPFSKESPLEPAQLSLAVSGPLGKLAKSSGWYLKNGLKLDVRDSNRLAELGPLKFWSIERSQLAALTKEYEIENRLILRSALRDNRAKGEKIAISAIEAVINRPIAGFEILINMQSDQTANQDVADAINVGQVVEINEEDLEAIQSKIDSETAQSKVLEIASHNALHRYLKNARKKLRWECPIPSPWLAPSSFEPTPFFPGIFKATNQMHALRTHFGRIPVKPPSESTFTSFEWLCGQNIIALCVFGFNEDLEQILEILVGRQTADRSSTIKDLLLVETGADRRVVGVRGPAAIALARLKHEYPNHGLPNINRLNMVVAAQLPHELADNSSDMIARLCATAAVTNIIELSGLSRASLNRENGCVAMSASRQRQLLESGHGSTAMSPIEDSKRDDASVHLTPKKSKHSDSIKQYKKLRDTLFIGDGPKKFNITQNILSQANIGSFRNPLCRELEEFLRITSLDPLVAGIAAFALHMTKHGTLNKKKPAWSTVYGYITSFGLDLVELVQGVDFLSLDTEEYIDLFQDTIDRKSFTCSKELAARELVNFHRYLQKYHGLETVDFSDLERIDVKIENQVDAEVIQPQEYALGMARLSSCALAYDSLESKRLSSLRDNRQCQVYAILLGMSGARHNEITALRYKDILATPDATVLFIRPSRYRKLKTSAARRMVDISKKISYEQRAEISCWIETEKNRLGIKWTSRLPIFSELSDPKVRASSRLLRDIALCAMEESVGYRTKIHRTRHMDISLDMLAIWFSNEDWRVYSFTNKISSESIRKIPNDGVILPRHIRMIVIEKGHRKSTTTMINYFHMSWATTSRAHQALTDYMDCHVAAVVLGTEYANAYKIVYRAKLNASSPADIEFNPLDAWLTYIAGPPTRTPGNSLIILPSSGMFTYFNPLQGRIVDRILRDIQRGMLPSEAGLVHGLTIEQLDRLISITDEVQIMTRFRVLPECSKRRSARVFQNAKPLDGILDIVDRDVSDSGRQLVMSISRAYLNSARKGDLNSIILPSRYESKIIQLINTLGLSDSHVVVIASAEVDGFSQINLLRSRDSKNLLNITLAWYLVVAHITDSFNGP